MTRGRLIYPFIAEIAALNTLATSFNGAPLADGYDFDFKEPVKKADGTTSRVYDASFRIECQVETESAGDTFDKLGMRNLGDDGDTEIKLCFHFQDLEDMGLVDANGRGQINKGAKLVAIFDSDGEEVDNYAERSLFVVEAQPRSYGLSSLKRNLLVVTFRYRMTSTLEA